MTARAEAEEARPAADPELALGPGTGLHWLRPYRGTMVLAVGQVLVALAILGFWEYASGRLIDSFFVSKPSLMAAELWRTLQDGTLIKDVRVTLYETMVGFSAGAPLGVALGFLLAQEPRVAALLRPFILSLYGIPRIALAPLFILWFGIGISSKIFLALMITFFLVFFSTYSGVCSVDIGLKNIARVMGASRLQMLTKVVLPAAAPWILDGLRISFPQALVAAVVAEVVMSTEGVGHRIILSTQTFNMTGTMAGVVTLVVVVMLASFLLDKAESIILRWRPTEAKSASSGGG